MGTNQPPKAMYVRATPKARHALKLLLSAVQDPDLLGEVTQEEFVTATWLWMLEFGPAKVADGVKPHVGAIRAYMAKEDAKAPPSGIPRSAEKVVPAALGGLRPAGKPFTVRKKRPS